LKEQKRRSPSDNQLHPFNNSGSILYSGTFFYNNTKQV